MSLSARTCQPRATQQRLRGYRGVGHHHGTEGHRAAALMQASSIR
jgi:hypothetical protein